VHVNPAINETSKNSGEKAVRRYLLGVPLLIRGGDIAHQLAATSEVRKPTFSSSAVVVYAKDSGAWARISRNRLRVPFPNRQLLSRTDWERPVLNAENRAGDSRTTG